LEKCFPIYKPEGLERGWKMSKRIKTAYPGVFFREARRIGGKGTEKVFYIVFKKGGKHFEEKAGRQFADDMTAAKTAGLRAQRIEGKRKSRKEIREQEQTEKDAHKNRWTINRLWETYSATRSPGKSLGTDAGRYHKYLEKPFGDIEPKAIAPLDMDRFRIKLSKKLSPQTVKHILNLLTWIINYGVKNALCEGISFHIKKPTVDNMKTEYLTSDQMKALLKAIEQEPNIQISNIIKLALFTGMRKGEILALQWKDLDFDRGFITLRDPKGKKDQVIPMNGNAKEILESHPRDKSKYVFPGRSGGKRATVTVAANRIKEAAGLPKDFRPLHGLRHVFASMLASSGKVDMYVLQRLLTHKDPRMTQRYAHLRDEVLKNASEVAGDLITEAINGKSKIVEQGAKNGSSQKNT